MLLEKLANLNIELLRLLKEKQKLIFFFIGKHIKDIKLYPRLLTQCYISDRESTCLAGKRKKKIGKGGISSTCVRGVQCFLPHLSIFLSNLLSKYDKTKEPIKY